ncbi:hypothetical protein ACFWNK_28090 [Streptomyces sp. NPDC058417]|uniref:hypothetical protein n=1 Tax=unclassified Streptomyces TaxID=2593676 RepID=UPI003657B9BC
MTRRPSPPHEPSPARRPSQAHRPSPARRDVGHTYGGGSPFFAMWLVGARPPES